ncbi:MAG: glycoside hydrolase family 3 C-terminal domain-containing protein, partial [Sedimentisphaerales bacterium]|nr:glycoside hydrolase family 3 C-terminal domain-containing protein [Sedimentisphaerales bacterium]
ATQWGNSIWEVQINSTDRCYKDTSGAVIDGQIEFLISQMTLEEKIELVHGQTAMDLPAIGRLGIPSLHMSDGPVGVRYGNATAFPANIALSASWDIDLAGQVGQAIAKELRNKGRNVILAPCMNIVRVPHGGRNFETFGEDPFLNSRMAVAYIKGVQSQKAVACAKHYACNNQEYERGSIDIQVDQRALHEIYLPAFKASVVEAGVWAVMTAYNKVNGYHCTENSYLQQTVLKDEWGFKGFIVSDWGAVHSIVGTANNGLDVEMPSGGFWDYGQLLAAVNNGDVNENTINDKVRRVLRAIYKSGMTAEAWEGIDEMIPEHNQLALNVGTAGIVLLKNEGSILPLDSNSSVTIAAIGPNLYEARTGGGGSSIVSPYYSISPLQGLQNMAGPNITITHCAGSLLNNSSPLAIDPSYLYVQDMNGNGLNAEYFNNMTLQGTPVLTRVDATVNFDWAGGSPGSGVNANNFSARWTGKLVVPTSGLYEIGMNTDDGFRLYLNGQLLINDWNDHAARYTSVSVQLTAGQQNDLIIEYYENLGSAVAKLSCHLNDLLTEAINKASAADVAILFVGLSSDLEGEGSDKPTMDLPTSQIQLIQAVAVANPNTIVVIFSGPQVGMSSWIDNVPAVMQAWYPGQECGNAVANILFGRENPSGKLPVTFIKQWQDSPCYTNYPGNVYTEGIFVGYRYYDPNVEPLFPFGYGLSYTTFAYSNLSIDTNSLAANGTFNVSLKVENTGQKAGSEVVQLYVADIASSVPRPPKELKAFKKIYLQPGEHKQVFFTLDKSALSYYDVANSQWYAEPGMFEVQVGSNSRDVRVSGTFELF